MAKNQTFSVSLNLLTKNFQNGVKSIQTSLNSLKMQFRNFAAAMGAGLGITELTRNMIDSARKLDKAQAVLKNVSDGMNAYADNQEFVLGLSKKYNQELTTLIGNYAKYHATANQANVPLEEQKYIFESLTRASAFFNLSADETNGVMLAITQMMSKGRVSSEELRRQLGERLPGAMGLMAKAMDVTNAELENMLKRGELLAVDALPKFARELNKVTQNINVDTIEGATNKLRNAFTNLTTKLNVGGIYKKILNGVSGGLEYVSENLKNVGQKIAMLLGTIASKPIIQKSVDAWNGFFNGLEKQVDIQTKKVDRLRERARILAQGTGIKIDDKTLQPLVKPVDPKALKSYEKLKNLADDYADEQKILAVQQDQLNNKIGTMGKKIGSSIKSMLKLVGIQAAYYAIAAGISLIVTKLVAWYREQKRIKNIVADTEKEYQKIANTLGGDDSELISLRDKVKDSGTTESDREGYLKRINQLLGLEKDNALTLENYEKRVNDVIEERLDLLKKEREYQAAKQIVAEKQTRKDELTTEKEGIEKQIAEYDKQYQDILDQGGGKDGYTEDAFNKLKDGLRKRIKNIDLELTNLQTVIDAYSKTVADLAVDAEQRQKIISGANVGNTNTGDLDDTVEKQYQKIQDEYNNTLRALNDRKKDGTIKQDEYDKALEDLTFSTLESIYALNDIDENTDAFAKALMDAALAYLANEQKQNKAQEALDKYNKSVVELQNQYKAGVITEKELNDEMFDLLKEVVLTISAMGDLTGAAEELAGIFQRQKEAKTFEEIGKEKGPEVKSLDTFFNYRKDSSEIYQDSADYINDYADGLKDLINNLKSYQDELSGEGLEQLNGYIADLESELKNLTVTADSFAAAARFAEVQEDVKNLKTELTEGIWDNITGIATAAERLTNSWKTLSDTMEDADASGWEKFLTVFTTIISTIETLVSVYQALQTAVSIYKSLQLAMTAAEQAGIAVELEKTAVMAAQAEIAKNLAVAKGMQSAAAVPYPANLAAIASTSAALAAAFAAVPKFAQGGIVQGTSTVGDRNLIRVNAGEAVLTKAQQGTLWNLLNGQNSVLGRNGGNVEFKIRGADLVGTINNYSKKISK